MVTHVSNFTGTFWTGVTSGFTNFMNFIPSLLGAVIILVGGWFVSKFVGRLVERLLLAAKMETVVEKAHISSYLPTTETGQRIYFSSILGVLAKWFIFLVFIQAAANTLGVVQITTIINRVILFIPNVIVAAVIMVLGSWGSHHFSGVVERSTSKLNLNGPNIPAMLVRYGILGFALIAAVSQLGVATNLINILFTGLVASLVIAFGLAFGLGGQGAAADITRSFLNRSRTYTDLLNTKAADDDRLKDTGHH